MCSQRATRLGIMCAAVALASCSEPAALQSLSPDAVIVAFGDSLTSGSGADEAHSYPRILAEMTGLTVINEGRPGETSADGLTRLPGVLDQHSPRLLILIHGGNDLLRGMDKAQTSANLEAMIRLAREHGAAVAMLGVPDRNLFLISADFYRRVADELSVPIDTDALSEILSDRSLKSDPIHPNDRGYRVLAEAVYRLLDESGAL